MLHFSVVPFSSQIFFFLASPIFDRNPFSVKITVLSLASCSCSPLVFHLDVTFQGVARSIVLVLLVFGTIHSCVSQTPQDPICALDTGTRNWPNVCASSITVQTSDGLWHKLRPCDWKNATANIWEGRTIIAEVHTLQPVTDCARLISDEPTSIVNICNQCSADSVVSVLY